MSSAEETRLVRFLAGTIAPDAHGFEAVFDFFWDDFQLEIAYAEMDAGERWISNLNRRLVASALMAVAAREGDCGYSPERSWPVPYEPIRSAVDDALGKDSPYHPEVVDGLAIDLLTYKRRAINAATEWWFSRLTPLWVATKLFDYNESTRGTARPSRRTGGDEGSESPRAGLLQGETKAEPLTERSPK